VGIKLLVVENGSNDCRFVVSKLWYLCSGSIVRRRGSGGADKSGVGGFGNRCGGVDRDMRSLRGGTGGQSREGGRGGGVGTGGGGVGLAFKEQVVSKNGLNGLGD
jgi:hypothetical protein